MKTLALDSSNRPANIPLPVTLSALLLLLLAVPTPGFGFTDMDAANIWTWYNNAFYDANGGNAYYYDSTSGGRASFWNQAEEIEMAIDRYNKSGSSSDKTTISDLCNGVLSYDGSSWTGDSFNDDIMWMTIAFLRAYYVTGNSSFQSAGKNNFDAVYARAYDSNLGGGLWWTTSKTSKNACVNGPGAIAAMYVYWIYHDSSYLTKAQNIYNWEKGHLFNSSTGAVYDHENSDGTFDTTSYSYNQGTFVGAADCLGNDVPNATLAANYAMNHLGSDGILPTNGGGNTQSDGAGFSGICIRWIARFMNDNNLQYQYQFWLQQNADAAWNVRNSAGLSWCDWLSNTPSGFLYAWGCSPSVCALQDVPHDAINPTVAVYPNQNLEVFENHSTGGTIDHIWQVAPYGQTNWSSWSSLGGLYHSRKTTYHTNADGTMQLFVLGDGGQVYTTYNNNGWSSWVSLDGTVKDIAPFFNLSGGIELFALDPDGNLWHKWEKSQNSYTNWSSWYEIGPAMGWGQLVGATEANGLGHAFFIVDGGAVYHAYENSGGSWTSPTSLGGKVSSLAVEKWPDGHLELFATCPGGSVYHNWESAANDSTNWSGWQPLMGGSGVGATSVAVGTSYANGASAQLFFIGTGRSVSTLLYNGGWPSTATSLGGTVYNIGVANDATGALQVFGVGSDSALWRTYQQGGPTGAWSGWQSMGGSEFQ